MIEYLRYFEYGKYFSDKGTSEYQILDRSPDELEYFNHVVSRLFPYLQDPSRKTASSVTVALFPFEDEYIFIQIERRHEGEYLGKLENPSTSDRTFAQSRVVFLKREQINYYFDKSLPLYTGLLSGQNITKIYTRRGQVNHLPLPQGADLQMERYAFLQSGTLVAAIAEESKNSSNHWSVNVLTHQMDWKLKLKLVEDAQMVMWHEWGLFTFASDTFLLSTTNIHFLDELSSLERVDHQTTASDTFLLSTRNIHFFDELSSQERADHQTTKNIHILGKLQEANRPIGLISEINRLRQEVLHLSEEYKFHSPSFSNLTEYLELLGKYIYQYMDTLNDVILRSSENKYWEFYLHEIV